LHIKQVLCSTLFQYSSSTKSHASVSKILKIESNLIAKNGHNNYFITRLLAREFRLEYQKKNSLERKRSESKNQIKSLLIRKDFTGLTGMGFGARTI
jgi:hypothetical protein